VLVLCRHAMQLAAGGTLRQLCGKADMQLLLA
jgi:hypothetical protein